MINKNKYILVLGLLASRSIFAVNPMGLTTQEMAIGIHLGIYDGLKTVSSSDLNKKIVACKNINEVYQLGLKIKQKADNEKIENQMFYYINAFRCFSYILNKVGRNINNENLIEYRDAVHNIGLIFYHYLKDYKLSVQCFHLAYKLNNKKSLEKLKEMGDKKHFFSKVTEAFDKIPSYQPSSKKILEKRVTILNEQFNQVKVNKEILDVPEKKFHNIPLEIRREITQNLEKIDLKISKMNQLFVKNTVSSVSKGCRLAAELGFYDTDLEQIKFKINHLSEFERVAREIKNHLNKDDLLVIIGRSPLYFTYMLNVLFPEIHFLEIPFTDGTIISEITSNNVSLNFSLDNQCIENYQKFMKSKGLDSSFFDTNYKRVVLIDRVESGKSLVNFYALLADIDERFELNKTVKLLGLVDDNQKHMFSFETILVNQETMNQSIKKHEDQQIYALGTPFYPDEWNDWKNIDFNLPLLPPAQVRLNQILEWGSQHR